MTFFQMKMMQGDTVFDAYANNYSIIGVVRYSPNTFSPVLIMYCKKGKYLIEDEKLLSKLFSCRCVLIEKKNVYL